MITEQVRTFLKQHESMNSFFGSLANQLRDRGTLSDRQIACVMREINPPPAPPQKELTYKKGDEVEINAFIASQLKRQLNMDVFFRRLEVTESLNETYRAVQVKVKFITKVCADCNMCGIPLETEVSRACGIGPVCAKKLGISRLRVEDAQLVHAMIDEAGKRYGEIGPIWIPKSQIKKLQEAAPSSAAS